ncbi:MAG: M43 family zinc metalloprotease [Saprospiraceae bacterium]|nr:M43 family zinc metalloprotease [Saprospiraceae bacterium]
MRTTLMYMLLLLPLFMTGQRSRCDVDHRFRLTAENPRYSLFLSRIQEGIKSGEIETRTETYFPVVIHVVMREPVIPVSVAQAIQQLDVLNADFAGKGNNIGQLRNEFESLVGDAQMKFCLATVDPQGQPTSGITRTTTSITNIALQTGEGGRIAIHWDELGGKTGWDPSRYINIWIGEYGGILGSASFPDMASYPEEIGLVIDPRYFGSIGAAGNSGFYSGGHTLSHEMGHFFGLKHIWGQGTGEDCNDSDDIQDTPNAAGPYYDCPQGLQESCGTSNMYQNFMDFTDDRCLAAFTQDQVTLMQTSAAVFYPDLDVDGSCTVYADTFAMWYEHLIWSYDQQADTYIVYNPDGWMGIIHIQVYSADGKLITEDKWEDQLSYLLDLSHVAAGVYFVRIISGGKEYVRKVVSS